MARRRKNSGVKIAMLIVVLLLVGVIYLLSALGVLDIFGGETTDKGNTNIDPTPVGTVEFHFIDVGQGDSALIKTTEGNILIDCGPKSSKETVLNYLYAQGVDEIKYAIFTHPHEDHMGCAPELLSTVKVENVIMPNATNTAKYFTSTLEILEEKNINTIEAKAGDVYTLGGMKMTLLSPIAEKYSNLNNYSIITVCEFGDNSFMFTGDAETLVENEVLAAYGKDNLHCDVLKVGHHGSNTSTSEAFLKAVAPKFAVISVAEENSYGHPNEEILLRLEKYNVTYFMTKDEGSIVFTSDGKTISKS